MGEETSIHPEKSGPSKGIDDFHVRQRGGGPGGKKEKNENLVGDILI